jgi:GNAT superfamily N-acetyltransferase
MRITHVELTDVPALARLMAGSPLLARYRTTLDSATASLTDALRSGDVLLAAREAELMGCAWLGFGERVLAGAAYLRLLLVAPSAQRHGVGTQLLAAAEEVSRARAKHLYLLATTDNLGARRFYDRHGYQHVGNLPGLVWPDLDEALYWKRLYRPETG